MNVNSWSDVRTQQNDLFMKEIDKSIVKWPME